MKPKYFVLSDPPYYLIGYGNAGDYYYNPFRDEFFLTARTSSKVRAEQIARLLNQDESNPETSQTIAKAIKAESDYIQPPKIVPEKP